MQGAVMEDARRHWPEEYYDAGDFFFWSANKLGHVSPTQHAGITGAPYPGLPTYPDVIGWLRKGEEPLNHILGIFFSLAPARVMERVFEFALGDHYAGPFNLLGTAGWSNLELKGATQPDFCFRAGDALLNIEGKIRGGKSRLEQVVKYGLLVARARERFGANRGALVYLTPYQIDGIFPQKYSGWEDVRREAIAHLPLMTKEAFTTMDEPARELLIEALRTMALGSLTYEQFDQILAEQSGDSEVEDRLVAGVRHELRQRKLVG